MINTTKCLSKGKMYGNVHSVHLIVSFDPLTPFRDLVLYILGILFKLLLIWFVKSTLMECTFIEYYSILIGEFAFPKFQITYFKLNYFKHEQIS